MNGTDIILFVGVWPVKVCTLILEFTDPPLKMFCFPCTPALLYNHPLLNPQPPSTYPQGAACPLVQSDEDDAAFPVLFQKGMIDDMKQELESGLKIKMNYKDGDFEQMLIVEEDLEFARFAEAEQRKTVQECVEKKVLAASAAYAELKEKYEAALFARQYADADENDPVQEQFVAEKQAILKLPDIEESIKEIMAQHGAAMQTHLKDVAERRLSKMEASLAQLEIIQKDIDDNKMQTRDQFKVMRVFPEADSIGTFCAFRPARGINKSVGRADETYPPVCHTCGVFGCCAFCTRGKCRCWSCSTQGISGCPAVCLCKLLYFSHLIILVAN